MEKCVTIKMLEYNCNVLLVYILIMFVVHALTGTCVICFFKFCTGLYHHKIYLQYTPFYDIFF